MFIVSQALDRLDFFLHMCIALGVIVGAWSLFRDRLTYGLLASCVILASVLMLPSCATTSEKMASTQLDRVYVSDSSAERVASCVASRLMGQNPVVRVGDRQWAVERFNIYGVPLARWDFFATPLGTRIEFRQIGIAIASGQAKAATCY